MIRGPDEGTWWPGGQDKRGLSPWPASAPAVLLPPRSVFPPSPPSSKSESWGSSRNTSPLAFSITSHRTMSPETQTHNPHHTLSSPDPTSTPPRGPLSPQFPVTVCLHSTPLLCPSPNSQASGSPLRTIPTQTQAIIPSLLDNCTPPGGPQLPLAPPPHFPSLPSSQSDHPNTAIQLPHGPASAHLGIYPREMKA